jgi:hypothetical protein
MDDLPTVMAAEAWGQDVLAALRRYFDSGRIRDPVVRIVETTLGVTDDGTPAVVVVYDHPWIDKRVGLRSRLDQVPMAIYNGMSPAESLAHDIARYEIQEPLGTYYDRLVEDDSGVWWWQSPMDG